MIPEVSRALIDLSVTKDDVFNAYAQTRYLTSPMVKPNQTILDSNTMFTLRYSSLQRLHHSCHPLVLLMSSMAIITPRKIAPSYVLDCPELQRRYKPFSASNYA